MEVPWLEVLGRHGEGGLGLPKSEASCVIGLGASSAFSGWFWAAELKLTGLVFPASCVKL